MLCINVFKENKICFTLLDHFTGRYLLLVLMIVVIELSISQIDFNFV